MPKESSEVGTLLEQAEVEILKRIIGTAPGYSKTNPTSVLHLAEALAWVRYPSQPHGGTSVSVGK